MTCNARLGGAEELRKQLGDELHAHVVEAGDRRADLARGTATIDLDGDAGELSVRYLARATPTARRIPLPGDDPRARSVAVLLVGNLARGGRARRRGFAVVRLVAGAAMAGFGTYSELPARGSNHQVVWPWHRVMKRFCNGAEDNVWHYYQAIVRDIADQARRSA